MSEPFLGEIRIWGCTFAPRGWSPCDGTLLPIAQNTALFSLFGTAYGGDGRTTFGLPNFKGRAAMHTGRGPGLNNYPWGGNGGEASVTLDTLELPAHNHLIRANDADRGNQQSPTKNFIADVIFQPSADDPVNMSDGSFGLTGGGQSHHNMQPYLAMNYCVALQGVFPSRG